MKCRICGRNMSEEQIVSVKDDLSEMVSTSPKVYSQINLRLMESIKLIP